MMGARSDASLAALLLTQRLVDADEQPLTPSEYWTILDRVKHLDLLLGMDSAQIQTTAGVDQATAERILMRLDSATAFAFELDEAEQSGLRLVASIDEEYPPGLVARLGRASPPLLYVVGDASLLQAPMLGIVGSRGVTEQGARVARLAAAAATKAHLGVVSGGAKGVDRIAMFGALEYGGPVVGVLADSLSRTSSDAEVRRAISDGQLALCGPYKPTAGFSVANAMGRNKLIYGLSEATLVVAADSSRGGTWAGAVEALKKTYAPVLVWTGEGAGKGNSLLAEQGAVPISSLDDLFPLEKHTFASGQVQGQKEPEQLGLSV